MPEIEELGAELWAVAPDEMPALAKLKDKEGLTFPILRDPDCGTIKEWQILNEGNARVPHPTAVVIDADGAIRYLRIDIDYKVRPDPEDLIAVLRSLK